MMNMKILIPLVFLLSGCGGPHLDIRTYFSNRDGNESLKAEAYPVAMEKYLEGLRYDPFVGGLHLNLGLSLEGQQQAEKALKAYQEAEKLALKDNNEELVFMARFNQGQLLGKAKNVEGALSAYQKALEIVPNSMETKTNIELLIQSQQGGGGGQGENQDQKDEGDQNQQQEPKDGDDKDDKEPKEGPKQQSQKYQPRPFNGEQLNEADVKKILGELKQQEERIRAEYNKREVKEQPRDKDW